MAVREEKIPFVSLATETKREVVPAILDSIRGLFEKSNFILGDDVLCFERKFADLAGCPLAVGVNSGLDALLLSLRSLNLKPTDEVITPPNSFLASTSAIVLAGAKPVFADVGIDYNIDPEAVVRAITSRTRAIVVVHLTGNPCEMDRILEITKAHQLTLIEDAAQAIGATYQGNPVGGFGDFGCFSLHPLKNLHIWGDGGVITLKDAEKATELRMARNHGLRNRDESDFFSYNSRLDTLQAIVGLHFLPLLEKVSELRRKNASIYEQRLSSVREWVGTPIWNRNKAHPVFHVYQVRVKDRNRLKEFLLEKGIETKIHYPVPIHFQKAAMGLGYSRGDFPVTEKLAEEILSLPIRENLTEDEIHRICDAVESFYRR